MSRIPGLVWNAGTASQATDARSRPSRTFDVYVRRVRRERFEWDRDHSPFTPEGQIESAAAFGRGLARHRTTVGRGSSAGRSRPP
jgi:hypothetical protein